ncbi:hypothetical protein [Escherichia coli]
MAIVVLAQVDAFHRQCHQRLPEARIASTISCEEANFLCGKQM